MVFKYLGKTKADYQNLIHSFLPAYEPSVKRKAFERALERHHGECGEIEISRVMNDKTWMMSESYRKRDFKLIVDAEFYDYTAAREGEDTWFVNFADPTLFVAYDSDLFAQDEIQTLEMPLLASCCLYLDEKRIPGFVTKTNVDGEPTPYLFRNVPYWIKVDTMPLLSDGTRGNIYGNNLMYASNEEIEAGIRMFDGDVRCNVLAMAAPEGRGGTYRYTRSELEELMKTVLCSFSAVRDQSSGRVVIHTGNWGCGAFGGNKELMYLAQMYAGSVCGIDELVLHAVDEEILDRAKRAYEQLPDSMCFSSVVVSLLAKNYCWGISDGN